MIREFKKEDVDDVMKIWLETNLSAHPFVEASYWYENYEAVKEVIEEAEVYIYEEENEIMAFLGGVECYVAGLFVKSKCHRRGIGTNLIEFLKEKKNTLVLNVYVNNTAATNFYIQNGFEIVEEKIESETNESEYTMEWKKGI